MEKIKELYSLAKIVSQLKKKNNKIVLCHGTFDLLHLGHIYHFNEAKKNGDILIVSVTPDKFINKGPGRPYFNLKERLHTLAALQIVDYVTWNYKKNSTDVIDAIKPNFYSKGQDYANSKNDITREILNEKNCLKKNKGKFLITNLPTFSSSKILKNQGLILTEEQNNFLNLIKNKYSFEEIKNIINKIYNLKILIIGEIIVDKYCFGETLGKSGKDPILMIKKIKDEIYLGGAGAIANHISDFVKNISLITMIGDDKKYENFIKLKLSKNIDYKYFRKLNSPTIVKKKYLDHITKNKIIGFYAINDTSIEKKNEKELKKIIDKKLSSKNLILISDYGHGMINENISKKILKNKKFVGLNAQINAANIGLHSINKYSNLDLVIINKSELRYELKNKNTETKILMKILSKNKKIKFLVVTRGTNGALMYNSLKNTFFECPAFANKIVDKIGAGDAMLPLISLMIYLTKDENLSLFIGSIASAIQVGSMGNSSSVTKNELLKVIMHLLI